MLHTMHDSQLIRRHTLDRAGIMFVTDLIRDTLTSPHRAEMPSREMDVISTLTTLFATEKCNYAAVMIWVCHNLL